MVSYEAVANYRVSCDFSSDFFQMEKAIEETLSQYDVDKDSIVIEREPDEVTFDFSKKVRVCEYPSSWDEYSGGDPGDIDVSGVIDEDDLAADFRKNGMTIIFFKERIE